MTKWNGYPWPVRHLVVALAYALAYFALVSFAPAYWVPSAGLRLACLLIFPYRYWPALLIGEFASLTYKNFLCLDSFGLTWAIAHSIPPIVLAMPIVKWLRDRHQITRSPIAGSMGALLVATVIIAAEVAAMNVGQFTLMRLPIGYKPPGLFIYGGWRFLGDFLGILVVVPAVLAVRELIASKAWRSGLRRHLPSHAIWEGFAFALIFAALMTLGDKIQDNTIRYAMDAAFFCPVAWLAFRHGWQGAAFGSVVASIGIMLVPHSTYDPGTLLALSVLAFTVAVMLLLGARTTLLQLALRESREHLLLARQELYLNEVKRRNSAHALDRLQASMSTGHSRVLNRLRLFTSPSEESAYRDQLDEVRGGIDRLRETLSPREWQRLGHPNALQTTVGHALKSLGVSYDADLRGALSLLTPDLAVALYRLGCEALAFLLAYHPTDLVRLQTSTHMLANGRIEVAIEVTSAGKAIVPPPRDKLLAALGAGGLSEADMRSRAKLYSGAMFIDMLPNSAARVMLKLRNETSNATQLRAP
ncbi:MAG: MASE1 domain-containing protein [Rhodanobacter sp.]